MNSKIKCVIIDDEKDSRLVLKMLLAKCNDVTTIIGEASNAADGYKLICDLNPDLVFLDIKMPSADGFSLLKKFDKIHFEVIFVTSYNKYAINAIKFNALDYILKPVETEDLKMAIAKASERINQKISSSLQIVSLIEYLNFESKNKKIPVHKNDKVKMIPIESIIYIEANGRYCTITLENFEEYTIPKYLKEFENFFNPYPFFIRINKSIIINVHFIKEYSKNNPCRIEMINNVEFEIPRRKKTEILEKLK